MGNKVIFSLGATASECPSSEKLITILASALNVEKNALTGVFCEVGAEVALSDEDARLAGQPTARVLTIGGELGLPEAVDPQAMLQMIAQLSDHRSAVGSRFATGMSSEVFYLHSIYQMHMPFVVPHQVVYYVTIVPTVIPTVPPPIDTDVEASGLASGYLAALLVAAPLLLGMLCVCGVWCVSRCRNAGGKKAEIEWAEV